MNAIKIAVMFGKTFSEFYDVRKYALQASSHLIIKQYRIKNEKLTIDWKE